MATIEKPTDATLVSCEVCLKQIPASEATVPEGVEYFVHFCGLECYEKWKQQSGRPHTADAKNSA